MLRSPVQRLHRDTQTALGWWTSLKSFWTNPKHLTCQWEAVSTVCPGVFPGQVDGPLSSEGHGLNVGSQLDQSLHRLQVAPTSSEVQRRITWRTRAVKVYVRLYSLVWRRSLTKRTAVLCLSWRSQFTSDNMNTPANKQGSKARQ